MNSAIDSKFIGEVWPAVEPFEDPQVYGFVELKPLGEFVVRSFASFTLTYTAGPYGIDDSGAIRVAFRAVGDWGRLQIDDPAAPNYASAGTSGRARLFLDVSPNGMSPRPRNKCLTIRVTGGYLKQGETITIIFGDTSQGSPGLQLQTFAESAFEFKVSVDPCAVGHFVPLAEPLEIAIVPDEPAAWKAVLPSLRRPAEDFRFGFKAEDTLTYAHVGGRYANVAFAHDPAIETAVEIHSAWGTFEWLIADCFAMGHRVGVVCNSDDHKGRPGASYPGASTFGAYGGLTCFLAEELTRDGIFECLRRRHHYGTTGTRLHLDVRAGFATEGLVFDRDPKAFNNTRSHQSKEVMMGDIAHTEDQTIMLRIEAATQAGIERIEIRNGMQVLETIKGYGPTDLGGRIRVIWSGAEYRGRRRETTWQGQARFKKASIRHWQGVNVWNPERQLEMVNNDTVVFDAITTGNFGGFDAWLDESPAASLEIETNHGKIAEKLSDLNMEESIMEAGGLGRCMRVFRLPDKNLPQQYTTEIEVALKPKGDNPLWVCLTLEDGSQAWSSPIYLFNEA